MSDPDQTTDLSGELITDEPTKAQMWGNASITAEQYARLMAPLNSIRVAKRAQSGRQLSYLESWDVRAHLIRVFGFGNFDVEVSDPTLVFERTYMSSGDSPREMIEVAYRATVTLTIRNPEGLEIARYTECAVGQSNANAASATRGDEHDNALKTAASDALKRCAINLGTQFGLSLYNDGSTADVVKGTLVKPDGVAPAPQTTAQAEKVLSDSLGAVPVDADTQSATEEQAGMPSQAEAS